MADSIVKYVSANKAGLYDKDGNYKSDTTGMGLALKYVVTINDDKTGYNVHVYGHAIFDWEMYSSGGPVTYYIYINDDDTPKITKTFSGSDAFYMQGSSCSLQDLIDNETAATPNIYLNWYDLGSVDISDSADLSSLTVNGWALHSTAGSHDDESVYNSNYHIKQYTTNAAGETVYLGYYIFKNSAGTGVYLGAWQESSGHSDPRFWHKFYSQTDSETIDLSDLPLATKPTVSSLANANKYNELAGVSNSTTSIKVSWTNSTGNAAPTDVEIRYKKSSASSYGSWTSLGVVSSKTLSSLDPRTTYNIQVRSKNSAGTSTAQSITIRTRSDAPTLELSVASKSLEQIKFDWSSNYGLTSLKYKVGSGSNVSVTITDGATNGSFTVTGLSPNTEYTVTITGVETLDDIGSDTDSCSGKTLNKVTLGTIGNKTHNTGFTVPATKPSYPSSPTISTKLKFVFDDYTIEKNVSNGDNSITFTEAQWDEIYKRYGSSNYCTVQVKAVTTGVNTYTDTESIRINLTGIQKTAHIGDTSNRPKRVQVWIGDSSSGTARRAVIWIGDSTNTPRRTI